MEAAFPGDLARVNVGLVVRPHWNADVVSLAPAAFAALTALDQGRMLGAALDAALALDPEFNLGTQMQQWMELAIFDAVSVSSVSS